MEEPKDMIVLGSIKKGIKKFGKISKTTNIESKELNEILEKLESRELIIVKEKKGWFGKKIEIYITEKGDKELETRMYEMQQGWNKMVSLYKSGNKQKLNKIMDDNRSLFPMMMFFGIIDIMMFSMMFNMIGASMSDYVPADQMPSEMDGDGGGSDMDGDGIGDLGDTGFDFGF